MSFFELQHQDKNSHARAGVIHTDHGDIETPVFMPVGTQASVKTLDQADLMALDAQIILGNTYHLHLRPGEDLIAEQGGLRRFMNWNRPILTDSGGFQVFSLGQLSSRGVKRRGDPPSNEIASSPTVPRNDNTTQGRLVSIDENGVTFTSHLDGSTHRFTPESAIEIQHKLGADIIMAFDECTPDDASYEYTKEAMERTHRWAERSLATHQKNTAYHGYRQYLFGIIQGAGYRDLREESARLISSLDFDGIAIGGESIGYNMEATAKILDWVYPLIPKNKPHYAMGIGLSPKDLLVAIEHGVDMFDCVAPTRLARHGILYCHSEERSDLASPKHSYAKASVGIPVQNNLSRGIAALPTVARNDTRYRLNIKNAGFTKDTRPIDETCSCPVCLPRRNSAGVEVGQNYTRSYLHHLFAAEEMTGLRLASIHNLHFMLNLTRQARQAILEDNFLEFLAKNAKII